MSGTIEKVLGNVVTLTTAQGSLLVSAAGSPAIQVFGPASQEDLVAGERVTVIGTPTQDGHLNATSITITAGDVELFPGGGPAGGGRMQMSQEQLDQMRQQFQGQTPQAGRPQMTQEQLDQMRQRFQGGSGQAGTPAPGVSGASAPGFAGRGGLAGTIDKVEGDVLTINTPQGQSQAMISGETAIQKVAQGSLADLVVGLQVTVIGDPGASGTIIARSITITR